MALGWAPLKSVTGAYITRIATNLSRPHGVVRDGSGFLYVSNATANTVSKFNPDYTFNSTISGGMSFPIGVGLDANANLFVSNNGNNTLTKYDSSGALTQTISGNLAGARWLAFKPYAVPEPSTYAIALAGLAGGGYSLLRRRRAR
jgi:DNA-binding beta-propeller fold protein YncE